MASVATFRPLLEHAGHYRLRLITLNLREYPGSSPFTEAEMSNLVSSEPRKQAIGLRDQAIEIATVVANLIKSENLPPPREVDGKRLGGVAILAWSAYNNLLLSLLSDTTYLERDVNDTLQQYLRTFVVYGQYLVEIFHVGYD